MIKIKDVIFRKEDFVFACMKSSVDGKDYELCLKLNFPDERNEENIEHVYIEYSSEKECLGAIEDLYCQLESLGNCTEEVSVSNYITMEDNSYLGAGGRSEDAYVYSFSINDMRWSYRFTLQRELEQSDEMIDEILSYVPARFRYMFPKDEVVFVTAGDNKDIHVLYCVDKDKNFVGNHITIWREK